MAGNARRRKYPYEIVGMAEGAQLLGITRQRFGELMQRANAPQPYAILTQGRVWLVSDLVAWAKAEGRDTPGL